MKIKAYIYPVLAGCCIFFSFETYRIFPLLFLLPFFLNGMRQLPLKNKLLAYWIMSIVMNMGGYHWISIVAQDYGGLPVVLSWGLVLLFSIFNNINFMLWAYLERFFGEKASPFFIAALFTVTEQVYPQVFPWYFGTSLDAVPVLYQTADLFGVMGLSFIAVTLIHTPWWLWQHRHTLLTSSKRPFIAQCVFFLALTLYGFVALNKYDNEPGPGKKSVGVVLIQPNTTMEKFYGAQMNLQERMQEFHNIVKLSRQAISLNPDTTHLVVWPEGSVHFPILNYPEVFNEISALAKEYGVFITAGSVEYDGKYPSGRRRYYNTQFVLNPQGEIVGKYHKIVLLAFGEYIPLLDTLPFLEKWLPESISHFTRGKEKPVFALDEKRRWLPLICYEDIITGFIAGFEHHQADFIVNITNDGWFGKTDASHLHKQMARPRTVEYRKPIVRALNTGSSQIIDAAGRIISKQTEVYTRDFINLTLNLPETPPRTVYSVIGNVPISLLIAVVAFMWLRKKVRKKS
ncbi:MAG: apolipoprotein N-acyltransferase, partial [bacterium]